MSKTVCATPIPAHKTTLRLRLERLYKHTGVPVYAMIMILVVLMMIDLPQVGESLVFTVEAFLSILPFLAISVLLAASLGASGADKIVARVFSGAPLRAIVVAALFGALSPFCSCGVVPIIAGMLVAGVPLAPVLAFCIASPIMDPEMFILTYATLGLEFAVAKTLAAMAMGVMTGLLVLVVQHFGLLDNQLKDTVKPSSCSSNALGDHTPIDWWFMGQPTKRQQFFRQAWQVSSFLGRWLSFAFLLESLMLAYIPAETVATTLGAQNAYSLPLATLIGIPAYMNGYAAIPLIRGLIDLGMSPATGMAFILAGSVTSIHAAIAVWTLFKVRLFVMYIFTAVSGAFLASSAYAMWL